MLHHSDMSRPFNIFEAESRPFASMEESVGFLRDARDRFDVLNLSYWFLGSGVGHHPLATWISTYDQDYMAFYMKEYSPARDRAFSICFRRLLPLDWDEVRRADETVQSIHAVAESFGVGRHGISLPIRDAEDGDAMFSINFECDDRHWAEVRSDLVNRIHLFAHYFHQRIRDLIVRRPVAPEFELAPREREVLLWAAEGKTAWETAQLLKVSERAVRLYMQNAMAKLNAKSKPQAVAIAVRSGILH